MTRPFTRLRRDRRGAVALITALMAPLFLGTAALVVDVGFWALGTAQLQIAADAGAMGAAQLLTSALKTQTAAVKLANLQAVAIYEAAHASPSTKFINALTSANTTVTYDAGASFSWVTVNVTSTVPSYFMKFTVLVPPAFTATTPPVLHATATASVRNPKPCLLLLGQNGTDVTVENNGSISAASCGLLSKSTDNKSITAKGSGTITATSVVTAGGYKADNAGTITPTPTVGTYSGNGDPGITPVAAGPAASTNNFNSGGANYQLSPQQWTGDVSFSNGVSVTFAAGTYYITNGSFNINGATVTFNPGVTFVLLGANAGSFNFSNGNNAVTALSAPTSGQYAGIAIWQGCSSQSQSSTFQEPGAPLSVSGLFYMPCTDVTVSNGQTVGAALSQVFNLVANSIDVTGGSQLNVAAGGAGGGGGNGPALTN